MTNTPADTSMNGISRATGARYDVSQHAREGGIASGLSRRLRPQRAIEAKILASRNGWAQLRLLEIHRQREKDLLVAELERDKVLAALDEDLALTHEQLAVAHAELRAVDVELERAQARLAAAREDDDALVALLREVGHDRVEAACDALGWIESENAALA
jgi:hypothetical protein